MSNSAMLLPRFTIRTLLGILTASAVVFVMVGTAFRGQYWAWGVTFAIISCIITALSHMAWFGIVSFLARMSAIRSDDATRLSVAPHQTTHVVDLEREPSGIDQVAAGSGSDR